MYLKCEVLNPPLIRQGQGHSTDMMSAATLTLIVAVAGRQNWKYTLLGKHKCVVCNEQLCTGECRAVIKQIPSRDKTGRNSGSTLDKQTDGQRDKCIC